MKYCRRVANMRYCFALCVCVLVLVPASHTIFKSHPRNLLQLRASFTICLYYYSVYVSSSMHIYTIHSTREANRDWVEGGRNRERERERESDIPGIRTAYTHLKHTFRWLLYPFIRSRCVTSFSTVYATQSAAHAILARFIFIKKKRKNEEKMATPSTTERTVPGITHTLTHTYSRGRFGSMLMMAVRS